MTGRRGWGRGQMWGMGLGDRGESTTEETEKQGWGREGVVVQQGQMVIVPSPQTHCWTSEP